MADLWSAFLLHATENEEKPVLKVRCSRLLFFTALDWRIDQKNDCHGNNYIACLSNAEIFDFTYFIQESTMKFQKQSEGLKI